MIQKGLGLDMALGIMSNFLSSSSEREAEEQVLRQVSLSPPGVRGRKFWIPVVMKPKNDLKKCTL